MDRYQLKTLPELLEHLQLDRLLSANGPLMDGILSAGASILFGGSGRPLAATFVQRVPRARDYDRPPPPPPPPERAAVATYRRPKITRMSMMGRPVRERPPPYARRTPSAHCRTDHPASPHRPRPTRTRTVPDCSHLFLSFAHPLLPPPHIHPPPH